jgi:exodeoxyribonuclease V gamma subunit
VNAELDLFLERIGKPDYAEPVTVRFSGDGWILSGRIDGLAGNERLQYRPTNLKPKDLVRAWILHVALNAWSALRPGSVPRETRLVGRDEAVRFGSLGEAKQRLDALVAGYLACRKAPLPVFEKASHGFVEQRVKLDQPKGSRARKDPKRVAEHKYWGQRYGEGRRDRGDCEDPYVALCFRGRDPFDEASFGEFERLAESFWRPVFETREVP